MTFEKLHIYRRTERDVYFGHIGPLLYFLGHFLPYFDRSFSNGMALSLMLAGIGCLAYAWRHLLKHKNVMLHTSDRVYLRLSNFFSFRSVRRDKISQVNTEGDHLFIFFDQNRKRYDYTIRHLASDDVEKIVDLLQKKVEYSRP